MWLLPKGAGEGCESCAASRWHSFGRHGMKGVAEPHPIGERRGGSGVVYQFSTCEMYTQFNVTCAIMCLLTLAAFPMEVVAAAKVAWAWQSSSDSDRL